ncbi:hypothetical protein [Methyloceanibacter sp.]|uniref:hypothetical protein n=1 Tax=Methyloceanibacter sp. TaxID=1965321 RepID=UPI003D9B5E8D
MLLGLVDQVTHRSENGARAPPISSPSSVSSIPDFRRSTRLTWSSSSSSLICMLSAG